MSDPFLDRLIESIQRQLRIDSDPDWLTFAGPASVSDGYPYTRPTEHAQIRTQSRWMANNHPFAAAAIEIRAAYVVGSGHEYRCVPRAGFSVDPADLARVLDYLEGWRKRDRWVLRQREAQIRLDRDGEVFFRLFRSGHHLEVRFVDPEFVVAPMHVLNAGDSYGVRIKSDDAETVTGYWIATPHHKSQQLNLTTVLADPTLVDAEQIQHRKANVDRTAPRGVPVLWPVREPLRRVHKILRSMSTVAGIQASVAAVVRRAMGQSVQPWTLSGQPGAGKDREGRTYNEIPPGSVLHLGPGEEFDAPANRIDVANYVAAIQAELRAIAARLCLPEYMLSGDASNANYSSTLVAEGPAVKTFERLQSEMIWADLEIFAQVLDYADRMGVIPQGISKAVKVEAEAPSVQSRNRLLDAQADQMLLSMGVISRETVAMRHGFDWAVEKDRIESEGGPVPTGTPTDMLPPLEI